METKRQPVAIKMDEISTIILPIEWGLVVVFGMTILLLFAWGIFGQISHRVDVLGVLSVEDSQSFLIDAPVGGFVGRTHVKKGDLVERGASLVDLIFMKPSLEDKDIIFNAHKVFCELTVS